MATTEKQYTRRQFCSMLAAMGAGTSLLPSMLSAASINGGKKRNVLFVAIDDLRPQLGCYGNTEVISPNIDALAADGMTFTRSYCQQAICAPSRASVLSGCRPNTTTVHWLSTLLSDAMPDAITLPQQFRRNGYHTMSIGKVYHHWYNDDLAGWSDHPVSAKGSWQGRGYLDPESIAKMQQLAEKLKADGVKPSGVGPAWEGPDVADSEYPDGANADIAIEALKNLSEGAKSGEKPFFLALGLLKPHLPFNAPKKYWDLYDRNSFTLPSNRFAPEGVTKYSLTDGGELRKYLGVPREGHVSDDTLRTLIHAYCACVSYVDAQLGRVLAELKKLGLEDDTVVMLWGDHGWKLGEHDSWSKHTNFEIDTHAPLIVKAPGLCPAGQKSDALVEFVDMYPSLCDMCGLDAPSNLEGVSFMPLLKNPQRPWKSAAFSQFPRSREIMGYTMRTDRYRYTEWQNRQTGEIVARELYDHQKDAAENINAAGKKENAQLVSLLSAQLAAGWQAAKPR